MTDGPEEGDRLPGAPHPRETDFLFGHAEAETAILAAWRQGRVPHAILLGGPEGIGKATLAYRVARFLLAHPRPREAPDLDSLAVPVDHRASRQVRALSHPDFLVVRRTLNEDTGKLRSEIRAEDVRRAVGFFGSTAGLGGYRIAIIDSAEELNRQGANSLLKVLEEPPPLSVLIIVSHAPGRLLPTIRSRCRRIQLRPLSERDVVRALDALASEIPEIERGRIAEAAAASGGSVRRAIALLLGEGLGVRQLTTQLLAKLPETDGEALHSLGERIRGDNLTTFAETVEGWLAAAATDEAAPLARLARFAETWDKVRRAAIEADIYNLDRKPLVFQVFSMLAEATRR